MMQFESFCATTIDALLFFNEITVKMRFLVLPGSANTPARCGGQYSYDCKANLLGMMFVKYCQNRTAFSKNIQKAILVCFLLKHSVYRDVAKYSQPSSSTVVGYPLPPPTPKKKLRFVRIL